MFLIMIQDTLLVFLKLTSEPNPLHGDVYNANPSVEDPVARWANKQTERSGTEIDAEGSYISILLTSQCLLFT